jgi:hypothetical protein
LTLPGSTRGSVSQNYFAAESLKKHLHRIVRKATQGQRMEKVGTAPFFSVKVLFIGLFGL